MIPVVSQGMQPVLLWHTLLWLQRFLLHTTHDITVIPRWLRAIYEYVVKMATNLSDPPGYNMYRTSRYRKRTGVWCIDTKALRRTMCCSLHFSAPAKYLFGATGGCVTSSHEQPCWSRLLSQASTVSSLGTKSKLIVPLFSVHVVFCTRSTHGSAGDGELLGNQLLCYNLKTDYRLQVICNQNSM